MIVSLFLNYWLIPFYLFIPAAIALFYNTIAEFVIPIGIPIKEAGAEMETHPVIVKVKTRKCSI